MLKKIILLLFVISFAASLGVLSFLSTELKKPIMVQAESVSYVVTKGSSLKRVMNDFAELGWVNAPRVHEFWFRYQKQTNVQHGEYVFTRGMTSADAVKMMVEGKKILRSVQFIEGKTFKDNLRVLSENNFIEQTLEGLPLDEVLKKISVDLKHPEGWFFPDTYLFESGTTDLDILTIAYKRTQKVLSEEWENKSEQAQVVSPYEALILASIIEKETGAAFERSLISGVFTRRLAQGMRLQTDPTVIYGLGESFNGNLTRADLRADTPYNTYTRAGLPPTPIASPGREAIKAALNPERGTSLFFVAKGDGTHYFSATLEEHNAAVKQYQRFGRRSDYQSSPAVSDGVDQ